MSKRRIGIALGVGLGALAFAQPWRKPFSWEGRLPSNYRWVTTHSASMLRAVYFGEDAAENSQYTVQQDWHETVAELRRRFPTMRGTDLSAGGIRIYRLSGPIEGRNVGLLVQTARRHAGGPIPNFSVVYALGEDVTPDAVGKSLLLALRLDRLGVVKPRPVDSF